MATRKEIILQNGSKIMIDGDFVTCYDSLKEEQKLTAAQQKFLKTLNMNRNQCSYYELYCGYSSSLGMMDNDAIKRTVVKLRYTFPECIKENIKTKRGIGYQLQVKNTITYEVDPNEHNIVDGILIKQKTNIIQNLVGDFRGYYLNPECSLGIGELFGAYLHIENRGDQDSSKVDVYAVLDICSDRLLHNSEIEKIFEQPTHNYQKAYNTFYENLEANEKDCFWAKGEARSEGSLVILELSRSNIRTKWTVILDVKDFVESKATQEYDKTPFRGGLGIVIALNSKAEIRCFRLGLIHRLLHQDFHSLKSDDIKIQMKIIDGSHNAEWKPLKLSNYLDIQWRRWIMKKE